MQLGIISLTLSVDLLRSKFPAGKYNGFIQLVFSGHSCFVMIKVI